MPTDVLSSTPAPIDPYSTPLIDVSRLAPGVRILVKDETRYVSGSHKEPAARAVIARAVAAGFRHVVIGTCGNYGLAMATATRDAGVACTVVLPDGWSDGVAYMRDAGATVRFVPGGYEDAVADSHRLAAVDDDAIDGNVDGPYADAVFGGLGLVVDALHEVLDQEPTQLWTPLGNGTTAVAVCRRSREFDWRTAVNGVGSSNNNPIVTSWPGPYEMLPPGDVVATDHNRPLVNWHALHGTDALAAIARSGGTASGVDDAELVAARSALEPFGAEPTAAGAVALAGLLGRARCGELAAGTHVVVLGGR